VHHAPGAAQGKQGKSHRAIDKGRKHFASVGGAPEFDTPILCFVLQTSTMPTRWLPVDSLGQTQTAPARISYTLQATLPRQVSGEKVTPSSRPAGVLTLNQNKRSDRMKKQELSHTLLDDFGSYKYWSAKSLMTCPRKHPEALMESCP
jgi:hypothetical protein